MVIDFEIDNLRFLGGFSIFLDELSGFEVREEIVYS